MNHPAIRQRSRPWLLSAPTIGTVIVFTVIPLLYTAALSVSGSTLGQPFRDWVGFSNFAKALDPTNVTIRALWQSVAFAFVTTLCSVVLGLATALILDHFVRQGNIVRTLLLLPLLTPPATVGVAWRLLLDNNGPINQLLADLGIITSHISFLSESPWAFWSVALADVWQWTPLVVLMLFAELRALPREIFEAAAADGASRLQTIWHITLPQITVGIAAVTTLKLILSFRMFDLVYVMTAGGPGFDTYTASYDIYRTALETFDIGLAAAKTLVFVVLVSVVMLPVVKLRDRAVQRVY